MSWPSGTLTPENPSFFSDDNSNRTQIGEQNDDMQHLLRFFNMGGQGQGQGSFNATEDNSNQTQEISRIGEQNVVKETVGLDLGKSSNKKHKKLRSDVWGNFEKYTDENGKEWAICNICKVKKNGSSKMGTTHLKNHFNSCSKNKKNEGGGSASGDKPAEDSVMDLQLNRLDKSNEGGGSASGDKPAEDSVMDQQLNRLDRVKMLIKQCLVLNPLPKTIEVADIIEVYKDEKEKLRIYFEKLPCRLSLMIDTVPGGEFICFWVRFIDDDWKLKEKIISLKCIGGDPIMKILKKVLSEWGIDNNISYMILGKYSYDHALSSNERENGFSSQGSLPFNDKLFCIRDLYDNVRTCSDCIEDIDGFIRYRMEEIFNNIEVNENFRILMDRARSLGKQVTTRDIPTEQDFDDLETLDLVEKGLGLKEEFFELENMDIEFKSINLTKEEWDAVTTFYDLNVETIYGGTSGKTANMFFPWLCSTYWTSVELVKIKLFIDKTERLHSIIDGMKCWYDDNLVLAVAAVLDPRFKMDVVKHWYKKIYGAEYETRLAIFTDYLTDVYNEYAKGTNNFQSSPSGSEETKSSISYEMLDPSGKPCKFSHDHLELHLYLEGIKFPLIRDFNILDWWQSNSQYFPTLARMARDFLSIQISVPYVYHYLYVCLNAAQRADMAEAFLCSKRWLE